MSGKTPPFLYKVVIHYHDGDVREESNLTAEPKVTNDRLFLHIPMKYEWTPLTIYGGGWVLRHCINEKIDRIARYEVFVTDAAKDDDKQATSISSKLPTTTGTE